MPAHRLKSLCASLWLTIPGGLSLNAQTVALPPLIVSATRRAESPAQVPFSVAVFSDAQLRNTPAATLDGALRSVPGFSLFRRSDSLSANPTAQGVSLRGLGPSGASRSLVLLDGVPLNDPFGGWVTWSKVPRETLAGAELVRGGGATAWGNAALGGVVQLLTAPATGNQMAHRGSGRVAALAGDFSTRTVELGITQPVGPGVLQVTGRDFATDGFALVAPEDRGPADVAAWSRHHWLSARWLQSVNERATLTVIGRTFAEKRGNGTAYQRNSSKETFGSVALDVAPQNGFGWTALAYAQDQTFRSTFSSVNATRTTETPASDQFAVPATALGGAWTGVWTHHGGARTSFGADLRRVRGETREHFGFSAGDFARRRIAGGTPTAIAARMTVPPGRCCATRFTRTATALSSARAPGSSGRRRRPGACVRPPSRRSAGRHSTSSTARSASATSSPRPTPRWRPSASSAPNWASTTPAKN
ncbi:MAG: TonB-dependent receptor plug domain-containing protein [Opitutae bacterium]|nr:TonB-dependent receptor plug domain-containing protein [Opitutae bacterium]